MTLSFTVPLIRGRDPRAALADGGRSPSDARELARRIQAACRQAAPRSVPLKGRVALTVKIYRPGPLRASADPWPLAALALDALTGTAYRHRGQVVSLRCLRHQAQESALYLSVREVEP